MKDIASMMFDTFIYIHTSIKSILQGDVIVRKFRRCLSATIAGWIFYDVKTTHSRRIHQISAHTMKRVLNDYFHRNFRTKNFINSYSDSVVQQWTNVKRVRIVQDNFSISLPSLMFTFSPQGFGIHCTVLT